MTATRSGRIWLVLGGVALLLLWTAVLIKAPWVNWAGIGLLSVPYISALIMTIPRWREERTASLCALGLFVLFCVAWIL